MTSLGHAHCHVTHNNKLNGTQETLECEWEPVDNVIGTRPLSRDPEPERYGRNVRPPYFVVSYRSVRLSQ